MHFAVLFFSLFVAANAAAIPVDGQTSTYQPPQDHKGKSLDPSQGDFSLPFFGSTDKDAPKIDLSSMIPKAVLQPLKDKMGIRCSTAQLKQCLQSMGSVGATCASAAMAGFKNFNEDSKCTGGISAAGANQPKACKGCEPHLKSV